MSNPIDLEAIARQTLGIAPLNEAAALADELRKRTAERDAWHEHYKQAERQIADLLARNDALQARVDVLGEFCRSTPQMREVIGELRAILHDVTEFNRHPAMNKLTDLLRRIDLESEQQPTKGDK